MKTENTPENKAAYYASNYRASCVKQTYEGQDINEITPEVLRGDFIDSIRNGYLGINYLLLTPLSQITDEHAIEVSKIDFFSPIISTEKHLLNGKSIVLSGNFNFKIADYLRSKGYLIGWRDLSAEDILSYGWAKIKEG